MRHVTALALPTHSASPCEASDFRLTVSSGYGQHVWVIFLLAIPLNLGRTLGICGELTQSMVHEACSIRLPKAWPRDFGAVLIKWGTKLAFPRPSQSIQHLHGVCINTCDSLAGCGPTNGI